MKRTASPTATALEGRILEAVAPHRADVLHVLDGPRLQAPRAYASHGVLDQHPAASGQTLGSSLGFDRRWPVDDDVDWALLAGDWCEKKKSFSIICRVLLDVGSHRADRCLEE